MSDINRFRPAHWPRIELWFSCLPGVTVHLLPGRGRPAAVLAHPNMPAAIVDLETGELVELHCQNWEARTDITHLDFRPRQKY